MSNALIAIASLIYFHVSWLVLNKIEENVPRPYMDEIFHIPQAQKYCAGNYTEWDEKITTLPGLYYLSTTIIRIVALALKEKNVMNICTVNNLRLSNLFLSTLNFIVIYKILVLFKTKKHANSNESISFSSCLFNAIALSLFPLNYFFQYLYYTDTGSTFFILFAYYQCLKSNYSLSALSGGIAVVFRQTNIIWVGFCMLQLFLLNAENLVKNQESNMIVKRNAEGNFAVTQQRNKKRSNTFELMTRSPSELIRNKFDIKSFLYKMYHEDFLGKKIIYHDIMRGLDGTKPYFLVIMKFVFFVYMNNGIVVGDRSNHKATLHLCQIFYFIGFSTFFSLSTFMFSLKTLKSLYSFYKSNIRLILLIILPVFCITIHNFSYVHRFLLADNRHYTFYIWSKIFRRFEIAKFLLTPAYLAGFYIAYKNLAHSNKTLGWLLAFTACVCAGLIPQELIEFRYFIIPYFIYRLNVGELGFKAALFEIIFNSSINVLTIYIFLNKTFTWPDSDDTQRFMW